MEARKIKNCSYVNHRDHFRWTLSLLLNYDYYCQRFRKLNVSHYSLCSKPMSILFRPSRIASNIYLGCTREIHARILSRYQIVAINSPGDGTGKRKRDAPQILHCVLDPRESPLIVTPNQIVPDVVPREEGSIEQRLYGRRAPLSLTNPPSSPEYSIFSSSQSPANISRNC